MEVDAGVERVGECKNPMVEIVEMVHMWVSEFESRQKKK